MLCFLSSQPVVNYPQDVDGRFTRIVEYKHFEWSSTAHLPGTTIVKEFSTADGEPYYPVPDQRNKVSASQKKYVFDVLFVVVVFG